MLLSLSAEDVIEIYGPLSEVEAAKVDGLLAAATRRLYAIGREAGIDLDEAIGDELLYELAKDAVVNAVIRVFRNPTGLRQYQRSETTGPFTESEGGTFDSTGSTGGIYIDPNDLLGLIPVAAADLKVGTVRLGMGLG